MIIHLFNWASVYLMHTHTERKREREREGERNRIAMKTERLKE